MLAKKGVAEAHADTCTLNRQRARAGGGLTTVSRRPLAWANVEGHELRPSFEQLADAVELLATSLVRLSLVSECGTQTLELDPHGGPLRPRAPRSSGFRTTPNQTPKANAMCHPENVEAAAERLRPHVRRTRLLATEDLCSAADRVWLKLESEQHTGSFKVRGALNKLMRLPPEQAGVGLVTASTGNHAKGFAHALRTLDRQGTVVLPTTADPAKIAALRAYGVELVLFGENCVDAEVEARRLAEKQHAVFVSPYNDPDVIAGQGTIAIEVLDQLAQAPDAVFVCVGGGGLISGIATWLRSASAATRVVGCLPANAPEMYESVRRGERFELDRPLPTLSDGSAGGLEEGSITLELCSHLVDEWTLVDEAEIADSMLWASRRHGLTIEGAAGVAVAACRKAGESLRGQRIVVVVCGGNVSPDVLKQVLGSEDPTRGR